MRFWQGIGETVRAEYGLRASLTVREEEALFSRKNRRKRKSASADAPVSHRLQTVDEGAPHFLPAGFQPGFSMRGFSRFRGGLLPGVLVGLEPGSGSGRGLRFFGEVGAARAVRGGGG